MKKIIFFTNSSWNLLNFRINLINFLKKQNCKIVLCCPKDKYYDKILDLGFEYHDISFTKNKIALFQNFFTFIKVFKLIKRTNPDFLISFTIKPNLFSSISFFFPNTKNILNITGLGTMYFKSKIIKYLYIFFYKIIIKISNYAIFQNEHDKILLSYGREDKYILSPGSGIDLNYFRVKKKEITKNISFLFVGRLLKEKGLLEFLKAAENIKKNHKNISFNVIGELDIKNPSSISKKILKFYINNKIINYSNFTNDVRSSIEKADCIILPSYREGASRVLLESGAMGKPCIASNVPGCNNIIIDNFNGFLCKPKNSESLTKSITKFIKLSNIEINKMSINARSHVEKNFDENIIFKQYLNIINE